MIEDKILVTSRTIKKQIIIPKETAEIADLILIKRKESKLTQKKLANLMSEKLGYDISYKRIAHWEHHRVQHIQDEELVALCEILGIDNNKDLSKEIELSITEKHIPIHIQIIEEFQVFARRYIEANHDILSKDTQFGRGVKADMREMLEAYFLTKG